MTDGDGPAGGARPARGHAHGFARHPTTLWAAFIVVHFWLGMLGLYAPGYPLGDVTFVYHFWVENGFTSGVWPGIDTVWVYPIGALVPMLAAWTFGSDLYASTWLSLVMLVDAAGFAIAYSMSPRGRVPVAAWWWLGFLVLLGPVALGRIDSITVPLAMAGLLIVVTRPRLGAVLLTVAAWIKVWPAALVGAAFVALRARIDVLVAAVVTSGLIAVIGLVLGAGGYLLSFVGQQTGRGMQIEAPIATFWMWDAVGGGPGSFLYYDRAILTFQVKGPGVEVAAALMTPLLAVAALGLLVLGALAIRRGRAAGELLPPLALALTTALILFNKVGSPQFVGWLAVPVVFGLVSAGLGRSASFRVPAILALVIAALTQSIYPYLYGELLSLNVVMVVLLSLRNAMYVALLVWAVVRVVAIFRHPGYDEDLEEFDLRRLGSTAPPQTDVRETST